MPTAQSRSAMAADPIEQFFAGLTQPGHIATFEGESATLRFEVPEGPDERDAANTKRWHVTVSNGKVAVTRQHRAADAVVRIKRRDFESVVTGQMNAQAAMLRGLLTCEGNMATLMMFQRCLPSPPGSTGRAAPISSQTIMAKRRPK